MAQRIAANPISAYEHAASLASANQSIDNWSTQAMGFGDNANSPRSEVTVSADPATDTVPQPDNRALLNANNIATMPGNYTSVAGRSHVAMKGDTISTILGTSDPQAIGNFMRANNLTSSKLIEGRNYFVPDSPNAYGESMALGQNTLNVDNKQLALIATQKLATQNNWDNATAPLPDFGSVPSKQTSLQNSDAFRANQWDDTTTPLPAQNGYASGTGIGPTMANAKAAGLYQNYQWNPETLTYTDSAANSFSDVFNRYSQVASKSPMSLNNPDPSTIVAGWVKQAKLYWHQWLTGCY